MKSRYLIIPLIILGFLSFTGTAQAVDYSCSIEEGDEFVTEVSIMNEENIMEPFGDEWIQIEFLENRELGDTAKIAITDVDKEKEDGDAGWEVEYKEWEFTDNSEDFQEEADDKNEDEWLPKDPDDLGKVEEWTYSWIPTPTEDYLDDINWGKEFEFEDGTIVWELEKGKGSGDEYDVEEDVTVEWIYDDDDGSLQYFRVKNSEGVIIFEIKAVMAIPSYDIHILGCVIGMISIGLIILARKRNQIEK